MRGGVLYERTTENALQYRPAGPCVSQQMWTTQNIPHPIFVHYIGCYQELKESGICRKFETFTVTTEDVKEYLCSFSIRCVYKFQGIQVNLYIRHSCPDSSKPGHFYLHTFDLYGIKQAETACGEQLTGLYLRAAAEYLNSAGIRCLLNCKTSFIWEQRICSAIPQNCSNTRQTFLQRKL